MSSTGSEKAKLEQNRFQALFENLGEPVVEVIYKDGDPIVEKFNDAFKESFSVDEEIIGQDLNDLIVPDGDEVADKIDEKASKGKPVEYEVLRGIDELRPYLFRSAPFEGPEGYQRSHCIYIDITELKEYEQELEEQRDKLELLNKIFSHDIRNDIQTIIGIRDVLEEHVDEEGKEYLESISRAVTNAVDLTDAARNLTDAMLQLESKSRPIPLHEAVQTQIGMIRSRYDQASIESEGSMPQVHVKADEMLGAVIYNLLQNAIEHNDKDVPEVTVSAKCSEGHVILSIADNGPGIPEDRRQKIFEKGEKDSQSTGIGLGLHFVSKHIDQHGGEIQIEDNEPEGSIFNVKFQKMDED